MQIWKCDLEAQAGTSASYNKGLHADGVTMDGMALSFHKNQARIVHPWKPTSPVQSADDLAVGALFRERVFVHPREARDLLLRFTRTGMIHMTGFRPPVSPCTMSAFCSCQHWTV